MNRALMENVGNMQTLMGNVNREVKTAGKNRLEKLEIKKLKRIVTEMKNVLDGLSVDWTHPKKESVSIRIEIYQPEI